MPKPIKFILLLLALILIVTINVRILFPKNKDETAPENNINVQETQVEAINE